MFRQFVPALRITLLLTVLTGLVYPALITGLARVLFPHQANGSLIQRDGRVVASELIGQKFTKPEYFHGRPSAAGDGYDAANSGGSNFGPTNKKLADRVRADADAFRKENPTATGPLPADLLTASGSGLDPDISPASAYLQVDRVAAARHVAPERVRHIVDAHVEGGQLGFLGEPRVNVVKLNLALDAGLR
jgi:potassium-transporting ATPase KdpC subunit